MEYDSSDVKSTTFEFMGFAFIQLCYRYSHLSHYKLYVYYNY